MALWAAISAMMIAIGLYWAIDVYSHRATDWPALLKKAIPSGLIAGAVSGKCCPGNIGTFTISTGFIGATYISSGMLGDYGLPAGVGFVLFNSESRGTESGNCWSRRWCNRGLWISACGGIISKYSWSHGRYWNSRCSTWPLPDHSRGAVSLSLPRKLTGRGTKQVNLRLGAPPFLLGVVKMISSYMEYPTMQCPYGSTKVKSKEPIT